MVKNLVVFWVVVWGNFCLTSDYYATVNSIDCPMERTEKPANGFATFQVFFEKQDQQYIPAACILDGSKRIQLKNVDQHKKMLDRTSFLNSPNVFPRNEKGIFVVYGEYNPLYAYGFRCINDKNIEETFFVKYFHHTGVTEKLRDMPECSVELRSDSVELVFDNSKGRSHCNMPYPYQTIIDPDHVNRIRKCVELGKIFVINRQKTADDDEKESYKVCRYKNNAYIHWYGWQRIRFFRKCVGKDLELNGFDKVKDVKPEEEMDLDLRKDWDQLPGYKRWKNIREIMCIFVGLVTILKLYNSLKYIG